ncbi:hypothetical protein [Actinoplanes sp. NPDC049118]|uniref:hypothetical protein n=1 Tax=Actinoplanes sp. NPDC049118 TaxID=3155769 RepID=UPI0033BFE697
MDHRLSFRLDLILTGGKPQKMGTLYIPERYAGGDISFGGQHFAVMRRDQAADGDTLHLIPAEVRTPD